MAWKKLITEDDFGGFAAPAATIGGAAIPGAATTAMRSDAAPELGPLTRDLDFGGFKATNVADPTGAQHAATKAYVDYVTGSIRPRVSAGSPRPHRLGGSRTRRNPLLAYRRPGVLRSSSTGRLGRSGGVLGVARPRPGKEDRSMDRSSEEEARTHGREG